MKSIWKYTILLVLVILSVGISYQEKNRIFTLLLPIENLKGMEAEERDLLLSKPVLLGVQTKEELETAQEWNISPNQVVVQIGSLVPAWYEDQYSLLYSNRADQQLILPKDQLVISSAWNLGLELLPSHGVSPVDLFGAQTIWVHRIFEEENQWLDREKRWKRYRRALRERSVHVLEFPQQGNGSFQREINEFLAFLGPRWSLGFEFQSNQSLEFFYQKWVKALLILFLGFGYGPAFFLLLPLLLLPANLGLQASGFGFTIIAPLVLYFRLQKMNSPGGVLLIPIFAFFHALILGGIYSLIMMSPELNMRAILPVGITFSLLIPILLIIIYELYSHFSVVVIQGSRGGIRLLISLVLVGLAYIVLITMIYRSSNHSVLPVWDLEIQLRLWFEDNLFARPRIREILGYLGLIFLVIDSRYRVASLRFFGRFSLIILLVSSLNTYSHFHTEFWFRVLREFHAFWIGYIPFLFVALIICRYASKSGVLHLGYFGYGNLGDDLLAHGTLVDQESEHHYFLVGEHTKLNLPGEVLRRDLLRVLDRAVCVERFSLGPGGIFQDKTSFRSLLYYLGFCLLLKILGAKIFWRGHGVSPLKYQFSRILIGWCSRLVNEISVRDLESKRELLLCSVSEEKIQLTKDLAFQLVIPVPAVKPQTIGIVLREWNGFPLESFVEVFRSSNWKRTYYLFQRDDELEKRLRSLEPGGDIRIYSSHSQAFLPDFLGSERIVSMRYHGMVLALKAKRRVLGISYDQKCKSLAVESGIKDLVDETEWNQEELISARFNSFLFQ